MILQCLIKIKGMLQVFISNIKAFSITFLGLEPITLIGFIILLVFDFLLNNYVCYKQDKNCFRNSFEKTVVLFFTYFISLFIIFSFTTQFSIIFTSIFNSIFVIIVLDTLISIFKSLFIIQPDSAFGDIRKFLNSKFTFFKKNEQNRTDQNSN